LSAPVSPSHAIGLVARALPPGFSLREREASDLAFLRELYAQSREGELRPVPWSAAQKRAFLDDQFEKQHAYYLQHYLGAMWGVITLGGQPVGRVYVNVTDGEQRLMDICLATGCRNRGVGTAIIGALLEQADRAGIASSLHVEPYNPARRLYLRMSYEPVEMRGVYEFMRRRARAAALVEDQLVAGGFGRAADRNDEQVEPAMGGVQ